MFIAGAAAVLSSTEVVVEVIEVAVMPLQVLVPSVGVVFLLVVGVTAEEIMRSW